MVVLVALVVGAGIFLLGFRLLRDGSLPGIHVAGADVGALSDEQLRDALQDLDVDRGADGLRFRRPPAARTPAVSHATTGDDLGYSIDLDATVTRVLDRGRQGNPVVALADQLRATFGTIVVAPIDSFDADANSPVIDIAHGLSVRPFYGGFEFVGGNFEPRYPEPGVLVSTQEVVDAGLAAVRAPGDDDLVIEGTPVEPSTSRADVDALVDQAHLAVDGKVELTLPGRSLTFRPRQIGEALKTRTVGTGDAIGLELHISPSALGKLVGDRLDELETPPVDATFEGAGSSVSIVPARAGFRFVPQRTSKQLLALALRRGAARAPLKGKKQPPDFTTAEARALDVEERVSTFTTYHACCEARVANIHRIADLVDGTVVEPGDTFSLNDHVGPRTQANGFVPAPAIRDGEFVEEVGGGISQFATTMFNAIFFGGYDLLEYQPHSYYISRYPPGREATISSPGPDLEFLNDSDSGIYIDTAYSETSITVSFYGNQDFEVTAREGPRKNVTPPKTTCRVNASLAPGEERVIEEGFTGFDIVVTRVFSDGHPTETFSTHYNMQERIVERRTCRTEKKKGRKKN